MIPTAAEMEVPLLHVLNAKGGKARPTEVYEELHRVLNLTDADLLETVPSGDNKFQNRTRWTRQILIEKGDVYRADYGVWGITEKGKSRLKETNASPANSTKLAHQKSRYAMIQKLLFNL